MIGSFSVSKPDRHRERISVLLRAVALSGFFWSSRNLENVVVVEYFAEVENGDTLLVTRPKYDMRGVEDMGLFYGAAPELIERRVSEFLRASDGGSTVIVFGLGGETALAKFPVRLTEEGLEWEPATLTIGGDTLALTRREPDDFVAHDYTFECFDD